MQSKHPNTTIEFGWMTTWASKFWWPHCICYSQGNLNEEKITYGTYNQPLGSQAQCTWELVKMIEFESITNVWVILANLVFVVDWSSFSTTSHLKLVNIIIFACLLRRPWVYLLPIHDSFDWVDGVGECSWNLKLWHHQYQSRASMICKPRPS